MAQQAPALYCVEFVANGSWVQEAWLPAPSPLPRLTGAGVAAVLSATALLFAVAWGAKKLGWTIRS